MESVNNTKTVICILLFVVGLVLVILGASELFKTNISGKDYKEAKAYHVIKTGESGYLNYEYKVGDNSYLFKPSFFASLLTNENSGMTVLYNPSNPSEAFAKTGSIMILVLLAGFAFMCVPIYFLVKKE